VSAQKSDHVLDSQTTQKSTKKLSSCPYFSFTSARAPFILTIELETLANDVVADVVAVVVDVDSMVKLQKVFASLLPCLIEMVG
jgi:hypothetical protein